MGNRRYGKTHYFDNGRGERYRVGAFCGRKSKKTVGARSW